MAPPFGGWRATAHNRIILSNGSCNLIARELIGTRAFALIAAPIVAAATIVVLCATIGAAQAIEIHQTRPGTREQFCGAMFQRCKAGVTQRVNSYRASLACSWRVARCTTTGVWRR